MDAQEYEKQKERVVKWECRHAEMHRLEQELPWIDPKKGDPGNNTSGVPYSLQLGYIGNSHQTDIETACMQQVRFALADIFNHRIAQIVVELEDL